MNIEKAKEILTNLKDQLKTANDQAVLYQGAVQGAQAVIDALEMEEVTLEEQPPELNNLVTELSDSPKRGKKKVAQ